MADKKPIGADLIARVTGAWKAFTNPNSEMNTGWMPPMNPLPPFVPQEQAESVRGRTLDFPVGVNVRITPRMGETVSFAQMRSLADNCDILRLVIETRKDQIAKYKFSIGFKQKPDDKPGATPISDSRCQEVEEFLQMPDKQNTWNDWLRMLVEEMLVTDALAVYPWLTNGGKPYSFDILDGTTIKRVVDTHGRTPMPPEPAYQQILKGVVASNYTADELLYAMRNRRAHKIYGYSPVEQIILTVNIAIRRALHQLQYYTEGSTPDLLFQVPADWNMTQIKEFNDWWQDTLAGNTASRRKAQFVPNGVAPVNTKEAILKDPYDEWLARVICYAFSVSSQAFIKENNRSTSETAHQMALEEGLYPILKWIKGVVDRLIWKYFGYTDLEFKWDTDSAIDPEIQAKVDDMNLKNGSVTLNQVREKRGDAPYGEFGDVPMVLTASGYVPVDPELRAKLTPPPPPGLNGNANDQSDPTEDPPDGGGGGVAPAAGGTKAGKGDVSAKAATTPKAGNGKGTASAIKKGGVGESSDDAYVRFQKSRKSLVLLTRDSDEKEARVQKFATKLAKLLKAEGAKLAEYVVSKVGKAEEDDILGGYTWDNVEAFQDLFGKQLVAVAKQGVSEAYAQLELDDHTSLNLANQEAILYAQSRAAELIGRKVDELGNIVEGSRTLYSIEESTRAMIRADITRAMEEGLSNDDLARVIEESYSFSPERAMTIARTETAAADTNGNLSMYKASGVVGQKKWIVGAGCCEICAELKGEVVDLNKSFSNGVLVPPAHPNCRCDFVPILLDNEDE